MIQKRYQYFAKDGIKWTNWFNYSGNELPEVQLKCKKTTLLNEYREQEQDEEDCSVSIINSIIN